MILGTIFLVFAILLAFCVPIGGTIGIISLLAPYLEPGLPINAEFVFRHMVSAVDSFPLIAIPLFILSGLIMAEGGVSKRLFDVFAYIVGKRTAGMPAAVVITCLFYGAISGSAPATTAAVGAMCIPILVALGYDKIFVTALVATSGGLGVIIPPSIPFILYGLSSGESVGALFIAGIIPGIIVGVFLIGYAYIYCKRNGEDKEKIASNYNALRERGFLKLLKDSFWAILAPIIILGGIYGGIVTPTEAADISVVYSLIISIYIYKTLKWKDILRILTGAVKTTVPILFVVATATVFGRTLTLLQAPQQIAQTMIQLSSKKIVLLLMINVLLLFVGMVMDTTPAILILTPILLPVVKSFGINPIHFGVIMVINLAIAFVTPPVGLNLYVAHGMTGIPIMQIARKATPFIISFIVALLLITFIPSISLILT